MLNIEPWIEAMLWAAGAIAVVFGFIANYASVVDWLKRLASDRDARPKLAFKATLVRKQRNTYDDAVMPKLSLLASFPNKDFDLHHELYKAESDLYNLKIKQSRNYDMLWEYKIIITNNSEYTAYRLKIFCSQANYVQPIDYTIPVPPYQSVTHHITINSRFHGTQDEASSALYKGIPFQISIEYSDNRNKVFSTLFKPDAPTEKQNEFLPAKK